MNIIKTKKIPQRKCVVTGNEHAKMEMFRIVRLSTGEVQVDTTGKLRGHGVYCEKTLAAVEKAKKKKVFDHSLECVVPEEVYDKLIQLLEETK